MPYTLWSRGRLFGESELAYRQAFPTLRVGDFLPNELGERLMPVITGVGPALFALGDVTADARRADLETPKGNWPEGVRNTTEYADAVSIADEVASLALEVRDHSGAVVEFESIWIQDTHRLLAMAELEDDPFEDDEELSDELREAIEHDVAIMEEHFAEVEAEDRPWEPEKEFPRYQIYVALVGHHGPERQEAKKQGDS